METAVVCTALLGLLVFGLGLLVSMARGRTNAAIGHSADPTDVLHKRVRAHANAAEYAPMMAVLILLVGARSPATWTVAVMVLATLSRYLHAAGMLMSVSLARPHPLRLAGAAGTYLMGCALAAAALASADWGRVLDW